MAAGVCGYAIWRGGGPERAAGVAIIFAELCTPLLERHGVWAHDGWGPVQVGVLAIDAALLAVLLFIAFASDRWWPVAAAAFQIIDIGVHLATIADHRLWALAYYVGMVISSYLVLAALLTGVVLEAPRIRVSAPPRPDGASGECA